MTSLLWLALATFVVVQSNVILRDRRNVESWEAQDADMSRGVRSTKEEYDPWLTEEQKESLKPIAKNPVLFREKVMEYFNNLSADEQAKWNGKYKKECTKWIVDLENEDAEADFIQLYKSDSEAGSKKWDEYIQRLPEEHRSKANVWKSECKELITSSASRRRRELDSHFADFTKWMTEAQKKELEDLKTSGKSLADIRAKSIEFFDALPGDKQTALKEEYKGKCKAYFTKISTEAEVQEIKDLYDAGNKGEIASKIAAIIERQPVDVKAVATKMQSVCSDVFAEPKKVRRDINAKIEKHLSWLTDEQKQTVRDMHAAGKPKEEIKATILGFLSSLEGESKVSAKEAMRKECYKWLEQAASKEEIAELHKLHETDHNACKTKVREYIQRLDTQTKAEVENNLPFCEKVWYGDHANHGNHHSGHGDHAHHGRKRRHLEAIEKYIGWLSAEQKAELEKLEADGTDFDVILGKVKDFYLSQADEKKEELKTKFKEQCASWVKEVATPEELGQLKEYKEAKNFEEVRKLLSSLETRLSEEKKHTVEHVRDVCYKVWEVPSTTTRRRREHHHSHDGDFDKFLSWTTDAQKVDLKQIKEGGDREAFYKKVMEYFEETTGEARTKAVEELKAACKHIAKDIFGEDKLKVIKEMKESGSTHEQISDKLTEFAKSIPEEERSQKALKLVDGCKKIFSASPSRRRRHPTEHVLDHAFEKHMSWTTQEQRAELNELQLAGMFLQINKKVLQFFMEARGEIKEAATIEMKKACKEYAIEFFGQYESPMMITLWEKVGQQIREKKMVKELLDGMEDEEMKTRVSRILKGCQKVYHAGLRRHRRDHHHHNLETAIPKYLSWTTQEQRDALKALEDAGNKEEIYKKVLEYFDATTGDTRKTAAEELKGACKHYGIELFGDEKVASLKTLKESGASNDELKKKVLELVGEITDEVKKGKASKLVAGCEKVYSAASRKRRDHHEHTLEDAFAKYLTWTTQEQKDALKEVDTTADKDAVYKKVMEFYEAATGETKTTATEELKGACKHYAMDIFGADKVATLTQLKETGATPEEMKKKVLEFVAEIGEDAKKEKANKLVVGCSKLYGTPSRKRRDHHEHTLDEALGKYLTWTTDEQKEELKALKAEGMKEEIYVKILEYFNRTMGATRTTAAEELKSACKHYALDVFGKEKYETLKALKESGASVEDIKKKVGELVAEIPDEAKKAKAQKLAAGCGKVYSAAAAGRKRREHHEHNLEEAFEKYLTWTSDEQKEELKVLKAEGKNEEIYKKILEYFEASSGAARTTAIEELRGACKHYAQDIFGAEKYNTLKELKESGASVEEIKKKVAEFVGEIVDEKLKAKAGKLAAGCGKVYSALAAASRKRRDHHEHTLEDAFAKYLTWTTQEQKDALKEIDTTGDKDAVYKKVMEFYEAATGETKTTATEELKGACKHYAMDIFGADKVATLTQLKETGATPEEMKKKVLEFVAEIGEDAKKEKANKLVAGCSKLYGTPSRKRRDHHEHTLEEALGKYLTWTTDEQKEELKALKAEGKKEEIYVKILEYFNRTMGATRTTAAEELKSACKHYAVDVFGAEKFATLKELKEAGASVEDIKKKVGEFVAELTDEKEKAKAAKLAEGCGKIYAAPTSRKRRDHHEHTLEEAFSKYFTWTTDEQKEELKALKAEGKKEEIFKKILEYFDASSGAARTSAVEELRGACKHYTQDILGAEKFNILKELKESGASGEDLKKKASEFIAELTDEKLKAKAAKLAEGCGKVYAAQTASRKRREHHEHTLEDAFGKYLTWLTEEQKDELKALKAEGKKVEIYKKIMVFFDASEGEKRSNAVAELLGACKHFSKDIFGEDKYNEVKEMKESGASVADMHKKVDSLVAELPAEKQDKAKDLVANCKKIYGAAETRMKRRLARIRRTLNSQVHDLF